MKKLVLIFLFSLCTILSFAQLQNYDISNYSQPTIKHHNLQAQFGLNGEKQKNHPQKGDKTRLLSNLSVNYYQYKRTPKYQGIVDYTIQLSYNQYNQKETPGTPPSSFKESTRDLKSSLLKTDNLFYIRKKRFIELDLLSSIFYGQFEENAPTPTPNFTKKNQFNFRLNTPILFGFGRINNVTENWRAIRMLTEFQKENLLDHDPTQQEINDLVDIFTQRRYKIIFDGRKKRKADLKEIHQILTNNNLINKNTIDYFSTLSDMWIYGANAQRLSGFSMALGIEPQIDTRLHQDLEPTTSEQKTSFLSGYLTLKSIYEKPINQKLQFSINSNIKFGQIYYRAPSEPHYQKLGNHIVPYFKIGLGFYPNSRTYLSTNISSNSSSNREMVYAQWWGYVHYYISPQTRIVATARFRIIRDDPFSAISRNLNSNFLHSYTEDSNASFSIRLWHNFL